MAIETNLNQSPYFDDFNEDKNFHRVLFRPGYAVQARELTQLQSILQNQIERFANEVMVDGTIVTGAGLITDQTNYVKLRDKDANNRVLLLGDFYSSGAIANVTITGETTGMTAKLVNAVEGSESAAPNYLTLYCHYTNSGSNNTTRAFADNETLLFRWSANNDFKFAANTITSGATGKALKANMSDGICYHKGNFIRIPAQSVIVGKYTVTPNAYIGLTTTESLIDSNQDSSLLDNASGATNYAAPGANRLKIYPTLTVKDYGFANTEAYFTVAVVEGGSIVQRQTDTIYADLGRYVAERVHDAHGNFVVQPFNLRIREHLKKDASLGRYSAADGGDAAKLVCEVEKGAGYVNGNKIELQASRFLDVDKAANTINKDSVVVGQAFGNYVKVKEVVGQWDFQGLREVNLYDTTQRGITDEKLGLQGSKGTVIGTARVRGFQWDSGTAGTYNAQYRIYLFDVQMNSGKSFAEVRSLYSNNSSGPKAMADIVLETNGSAKIQEPGLNTMVFPLGQKAARTLKDSSGVLDTRFVYRTEREASFGPAGTATIDLTSNTAHTGGAEAPWNTGNTITDVSESRNYIVVAKSAVSTEPHTGQVTTISGNTITGTSTIFESAYQVGDFITIGGNNPARITAINSDTEIEVANTVSVTTTPVPHKTTFPSGYIFDLSSNGTIIATGTPSQVKIDLKQANLASSFAASVYFNVYRSSARQTAKSVNKNKYISINTGSHSASKTGPWPLGVSDAYKIEAVYLSSSNSAVTSSDTDVTTHFELDDGQKDSFYDTSYLVKKADSTLDITNKAILVKFNYFSHSRTQGIGYLSVDSYPTSNTNPTESDKIKWEEISVFRSPTNGRTYDLRDHIDFRQIKTNTVTPTAVATMAGSPTNPTASSTYDIDSDGAYVPTPDENFVCDAQFYLPRKDRIVITKGGAFQVVKGVPDLNPRSPGEIAGSMTLGILDIPPFPSLSPYVAKQAKRSDYQVKLTLENNRRYTMADLRAVDQRVRNLEYYSTLNLLENATKGKQIFNSDGTDRFKNGFFVDDMGSHVNSDTSNKYYRAAIDVNEGVMRPTFTRSDIALERNTTTSTGVAAAGDLLLLDYSANTVFIDQPYASKLRNPVQELLFNWRGQVTLNPPADNTPDITQLPDVQLDFSGFYDAIETIAQQTGLDNGQIQWGGWQQSGRTRTNTGIKTTLSSVTETISLGNTIENISTREYMRAREIQFTGFRMKPNTRVYAYFDEEPVSDYCTPTNSSFVDSGLEGASLITDSTGSVYGKFRIPDNDDLRFRVGTKRFVLKDVSNPITQADLVTTSAHGEYTSNPLDITMRGTDVNMQIPQFSQETVVEKQVLHTVADGDRSWWDPIAQTFNVNVSGTGVDGVYITKLDLYFGKKDSALPITLQIRQVVNGFPTETIVPYAIKTLTPAEINVSSDASVATTFTFDTPVYLKNNTDYAFIVIPGGNSDQYAVWTAQMGGDDVLRPNTLINKQTYSGVLFSSSNDKTWNPIQDEDIKFTMYRADFGTSGTVYIENKDQEFFSVDNLNGTFRVGETLRSESLLTFANTADQSFYTVGQVIQSKSAYDGDAITDSQFANGTIREIVSANSVSGTVTVKIDAMGTFPTTATNNENRIFLPGNSAFVGTTSSFTANTATGIVNFYDSVNGKLYVDDSTGGFANGWVRGLKSGGTARVTSVDDLTLNTLVPKIPEIKVARTNASWAVKTTSSSGVLSTKWETISLGEDNNFYDNEKKVYSKSNEDTFLSGAKSLQIRGTFTSEKSAVSPVIDTTRMNGIVLGNIINNVSTNEEGNYGDAAVRYISKKIELADGQDAEDMLVYVDAFKPSGTDIQVYARVINAEDPQAFDNKDYTLLRQVTAANTVSSGFDGSDIKEFEYTFSANSNGDNFLGSNDDNQAKLNTGNNNVVSYRSDDGSIYHGYKTFAIKIVMTASGTNLVPLVDDLRVIALQK
jgi:hypothetical protein